MIVKLTRGSIPGEPWLLYADPAADNPIIDFIHPTVDLLLLLGVHETGYFEADEVDGEWNIRRKIADQGW